MADEFNLNDYADLFSRAEKQYNLPTGLLYRVAHQESKGDPTAESEKGAQGLMQFLPETSKSLGVDPFNPEEAIPGAAKLLRENLDRYKNLPDAVSAYHGGTDKDNWGVKTKDYVQKVLGDNPKLPTVGGQQVATNMQMTPVSYDASNDPLTQKAAQAQSDDPLMARAAQLKSGSEDNSDDPLMQRAEQMKSGIITKDLQPMKGNKSMAGGGTQAQPSSEPLTKEAEIQKKIDDLPLPQRVMANMLAHPENATLFGAVKNIAGGDAVDYAKDYGNNLLNAGKSIKDIVTFTNDENPLQAAVQKKDKAGLPVSVDERAEAFNEAMAHNPGGKAASISQVIPVVSAATSFINRGVNPLIGATTGLTPAEIQAGEAALPVVPGASKIIRNMVNSGAEDISKVAGKGGKVAVKLSPIPTEGQVNEKISGMAGGEVQPDLTEYVPGSKPTLGTATANPALATEERSLRAANPNAFPVMENQSARANYLQDVIGSPQDLEILKLTRDEQAIPLKTEAFAKKQPVSAQPVLDQIDQILKSPAGKTAAVRTNLNEIKSNLYDNLDPETGKLESDPEQLEGVRQAIASSLTKQAAMSGSTARQASRQLATIMDTLDNTIEKGAPGYANYRKTYSDMSKAIDEKEYLQDLGFTDSNGNVVPKQLTLNKVERVLNNISSAQKAGGVNPAKNISPETITKLENIRSDLRREANIDLGKNRGSTTTTELNRGKKAAIANVLTGALAAAEYSHNPIVSGAVLGGRMLYNYKNNLMQKNMLNKFINPQDYVASVNKLTSLPATGNNAPALINNIQK